MNPQMFTLVLVGSQSSGNIGAVARVMMNMGFSELRLVNPDVHHLNRECLDRAMAAAAIVQHAKVFLTLKEALTDCHQVIGTSGKTRQGRVPWKTPRELAQDSMLSMQKKTALVFGPEDRGLSNDDLLLCDQVINIPTSEKLPSLNLSHAVLIVLYEIFLARGDGPPAADGGVYPYAPTVLATHEKKESFFDHLQESLQQIGFLEKTNPDKTMRTLRTLFARASLDDYEVGVLRGICRQIINRTLKDEKK